MTDWIIRIAKSPVILGQGHAVLQIFDSALTPSYGTRPDTEYYEINGFGTTRGTGSANLTATPSDQLLPYLSAIAPDTALGQFYSTTNFGPPNRVALTTDPADYQVVFTGSEATVKAMLATAVAAAAHAAAQLSVSALQRSLHALLLVLMFAFVAPAFAGGEEAAPAAQSSTQQLDTAGAAVWDRSVFGEENAPAYRAFWKARIMDYLGRYAFLPKLSFCEQQKDACEQFYKKLSAGHFEIVSPSIFSPNDIKPILDGDGADIEAKCPNYFFSVGAFPRTNENFPVEKAPFLPTRNFAVYDLTHYLDPKKMPGVDAVKVIRAEYYYAYEEESKTLTDQMMDWGGSTIVTLPDCKIRGLTTAYSSTVDGRDVAGDPYPGIRELILMDGRLYSLAIGHIRDKQIAGNVGYINIEILALSEQNLTKPQGMYFQWRNE